MLRELKDQLVHHKNRRSITHREIGVEADCTTAQVSNASGHQATFEVYQKLMAWAEKQA